MREGIEKLKKKVRKTTNRKKIKGKRNNSISKQLISKNTIMIVIIGIIFSASSYILSKKALLDNSKLMLEELALSTSAQIEESLMRSVDIAQTLSGDKVITSDTSHIRDKLSTLTRNHVLFQHNSVGFIDMDGECRDTDGIVLDVGDKEYFQRAINGEVYISAPYFDRVTGELETVYAVPVREVIELRNATINDPVNKKIEFGDVLGVVVVKRPGSDFTDIANSVKFGESGAAQIIDQYGTTIAHEDAQLVEEQLNLIEEDDVDPSLSGLQEMQKTMFQNLKGVGTYFYNGEEKTMAYAPIEYTDWVVGISVNTRELLKQVPVLGMWLLISALACVVLGIIMAIIFANGLVRRLARIKENVVNLAGGDFTSAIENTYINDEIGDISKAIEKTKKDIVQIIKDIKTSSNHLESEYLNLLGVSKEFTQVSGGISIAVQQAAEGSYVQATDLSNVNEKFVLFNDKITKSVEQIKDISISNDTVFERAGKSNSDMERLSFSMNEIGRSFNDVEESIQGMKTSMDQVSKVTNVINNIAEQTNLLSLNATIEAARAGEAGKGFSVVASEIRKLSQQSKEALDQIHHAVNETIKETKTIIEKTDVMKESLEDGVKDVEKGIISFNTISKLVMDMVPKIREISKNTNEIAEDKQDITISIESISNVSEEISATTEEITSAMEGLVKSSSEVEEVAKRLSTYTAQMRKATDEFKI